jgi:hypothetical protein
MIKRSAIIVRTLTYNNAPIETAKEIRLILLIWKLLTFLNTVYK